HMQQPTESDDESMYNDDDDIGEPETQTQLQSRKKTKQIKSCWIDHAKLFSRGNSIVNKVTSYLEDIESILTILPASTRAMLQPCFSSLRAESITFLSKMTERIIRDPCASILNELGFSIHDVGNGIQYLMPRTNGPRCPFTAISAAYVGPTDVRTARENRTGLDETQRLEKLGLSLMEFADGFSFNVEAEKAEEVATM
nr:hypothetical protein [Tanacetum cinerariifolium]